MRHTHDWCALVRYLWLTAEKIFKKPTLSPHANRYSTCTVRFRSNTRYRTYLIPVPEYSHEIDQSGLHLFSHRFGCLLLGWWLVGNIPLFCPKNLIRWRWLKGKRYFAGVTYSDPMGPRFAVWCLNNKIIFYSRLDLHMIGYLWLRMWEDGQALS